VERVEEACNAGDPLMLKTVLPANSSNGMAVVWSHRYRLQNREGFANFLGKVAGETMWVA
jgi:hypothetical protein